jgi:2,3-bisphosphoglycerate-dependent phosphoglycerate mutase
MPVLVLLRHGESEWNSKNLFAGWVDVDLTPDGEREARRAGDLLVDHDLLPDVLHTSVLRRAIRTAQIALDITDRQWIPVRRSWRLNERHYGALQGKNRAQVREEFGDEQFTLWRRSYDTAPPPLRDDECGQAGDPRYAHLLETMPRTECLKDVVGRMLPYWYGVIVPDLRLYAVVLVVAHSNSLRALKKHLDGLSDEEVVALNIPTGIPLRYELDPKTMHPTRPADYLDPQAAATAIKAVADQGSRQPPAHPRPPADGKLRGASTGVRHERRQRPLPTTAHTTTATFQPPSARPAVGGLIGSACAAVTAVPGQSPAPSPGNEG